MAEIAEVHAAIADVVTFVEDLDDDTRRRIPDRTVSARITDLDLAFAGRFSGGHLVEVAEVDPALAREANLRLGLSSDDLLELVAGRLNFASGWAKGRIKVDARLRDVFELRRFL
jgi:hypothetical protein